MEEADKPLVRLPGACSEADRLSGVRREPRSEVDGVGNHWHEQEKTGLIAFSANCRKQELDPDPASGSSRFLRLVHHDEGERPLHLLVADDQLELFGRGHNDMK